MTVLRKTINLTRVTALESRFEKREGNEAAFLTPAMGSGRMISSTQQLSSNFIRIL